MDALIIRKACLGDVICAEPFIRALVGYERIAMEADLYNEVFENHPLLVPKSALQKSYKTFDLTGVYERNLQTHICKAYLVKFDLKLDNIEPRIYLTEEEKSWGKSLLPGKWAVLDIGYPGGSLQRGFWDFINWKPICDFLKSNGFKIAYVGGGPYSGSKTFDLDLDLSTIDLDLRGKTTLRQLFSIIFNCSVFVGVDSGPMHVAQSFKISGVAIFNPKHPAHLIISKNSSIIPIHASITDPLPIDEIIKKAPIKSGLR